MHCSIHNINSLTPTEVFVGLPLGSTHFWDGSTWVWQHDDDFVIPSCHTCDLLSFVSFLQIPMVDICWRCLGLRTRRPGVFTGVALGVSSPTSNCPRARLQDNGDGIGGWPLITHFTPWKIILEPKNHPTKKENHLPNLHFWFHLHFTGCIPQTSPPKNKRCLEDIYSQQWSPDKESQAEKRQP